MFQRKAPALSGTGRRFPRVVGSRGAPCGRQGRGGGSWLWPELRGKRGVGRNRLWWRLWGAEGATVQGAAGRVESAPSAWRVGKGPAARVCSAGRTNAPSGWRVGMGPAARVCSAGRTNTVPVESLEQRRPGGPAAGPQAPEALCSCSGDSRRPSGFHCCLGECLVIIGWFVLLWSFVG